MTEYRTDEEQIEVLKRWWQEYGRSIITGVVLAVFVIGGWQMWQGQKIKTNMQSSYLYDQFINSIDEGQEVHAGLLGEKLKNEYESSSYAQLASLMLAKKAVELDNYQNAQEQLQWVLDHDPHPDTKLLTQLRLARVLFSTGENDHALDLLKKTGGKESSYLAAFDELRGDILLTMGEKDAAGKAYQNARLVTQQQEGLTENRMLDMKLKDLGLKPEISANIVKLDNKEKN